MVEAAGDGRLLVELRNGHRFTIPPQGGRGSPRHPRGTRGQLELHPDPASAWRFVAAGRPVHN